MLLPLFALLTFANPVPDSAASVACDTCESEAPRDSFEIVAARGVHMIPAIEHSLSKKEEWLLDKRLRPEYHMSDRDVAEGSKASALEKPRRRSLFNLASDSWGRPGERIAPVTTLFNIWTKEALPVLPGDEVQDRFHRFLRDHYTNQATWMDTRLIAVLAGAARRFSADRIEIVSGYRSPKYNLILRKKGHQVARQSQHTEGHAVDFRIPGVPTQTLLGYVRSLRLGGVGFYPHSRFVHSDTGRVRYWTGS